MFKRQFRCRDDSKWHSYSCDRPSKVQSHCTVLKRRATMDYEKTWPWTTEALSQERRCITVVITTLTQFVVSMC
ncbi:hypothetical protein Ae201684_018666 [Aphanomyces euteiches]|uniref:Uncharacterized protein n=1 Tax=Aphanomyces euteiches TaxID=100861 RepID=A0A6G0W530_9STRA|nr:hypothetical protein Ae201684_018666 [Aphanomyces euteiches]